MKLGTLIKLDNSQIDAKFKQVSEFGFSYCQISAWDKSYFTDETAEKILSASEKYNVKISTFWCGWTGPRVWNFYDGQITLGLVPPDFRSQRINDLAEGSDFAKKLGIANFATHAGFLPENPYSGEYRPIVSALRTVAQHCKDNGQIFLFETGQETPVTLRRVIEDIGMDNLGINLDPANLILYGKANPVDSLDVFGEYVVDIHAKDGCYPTDGKNLGREVPIGEGSVNFPVFIQKLKKIGYDGTLIIEREITGEQQSKDILSAKKYLEALI